MDPKGMHQFGVALPTGVAECSKRLASLSESDHAEPTVQVKGKGESD